MRQSSDSSARAISKGSAALILLFVGLSSALCYAAALTHFPLLAIYAQPIQNLEKLTKSDPWTGLALTGWTLTVFAGYAVGAIVLAREARQSARADQSVSRRAAKHSFILVALLIAFPLIFSGLLAYVYPTTSVDLYDYMFRGRMLAYYQANTFVQVPVEFNSDPLFWYVAWRKAVTAYGPLWEGMSWLTARLAGERPGRLLYGEAAQFQALLQLMLAYKALSGLGFLACGAAIWVTLRRTAFAWRWLGLYLWLWNPLALWESLAAGHNDAWMAMLIVLAVGLLVPRQDKETGRQGDGETGRRGDDVSWSANLPVPLPVCIVAFLMLTLGGLVKYLALMFGPLLLCAALRDMPNWRARLRLVLAGGLACVAVVVLAYAPFWVGWGTLRNFGDRGTLFTNSWLAALQAPITLKAVQALLPARDLLALVSIGPHSEAISQAIAVSIGLGLLVFGVLWASWRAWLAPDEVAAHALWLLLWFLFLCNPWFQPWYLLWALALVAIQPWRSRHMWAVVVFCVTAMLSYLSVGFLLPLLGWTDSSAEWTTLISLLIYGPPLLVLLSGRRLGLAQLRRVRLRHQAPAREKEPVGG